MTDLTARARDRKLSVVGGHNGIVPPELPAEELAKQIARLRLSERIIVLELMIREIRELRSKP